MMDQHVDDPADLADTLEVLGFFERSFGGSLNPLSRACHVSVSLGCQSFESCSTYPRLVLSTAPLVVQDPTSVLMTPQYYETERQLEEEDLLAIQHFDLILCKYGLFFPVPLTVHAFCLPVPR